MSQQLIEMRGPVSALSDHSLIAILPPQTELIGFENKKIKKITLTNVQDPPSPNWEHG